MLNEKLSLVPEILSASEVSKGEISYFLVMKLFSI